MDAVEAHNSKAQAAPQRRGLVAALVTVATVVAFVAIFSVWIDRQALNTDNWTNTSSNLLQDERIKAQVASFLVDQVYAHVDVQAKLQSALPSQLKPLAGPAAGGLRQVAGQVAERALGTSQVQDLWRNANRAAHKTLLKVINGGGKTVSTENGTVTLNLRSLLGQVADRIGVDPALANKIPANAGSLVILRSSQIATAQRIARGIHALAVVLTVLAIFMYALAVFVARGQRRVALRGVGFGLIAAGVVALVARGLAGDAVVSALTKTESVRPAADAAWSIGTSLLVTIASSTIAFGVLLVIGAWLAGPARVAVALRGGVAPYLRERPGLTHAAVGAIFLALIAWGPIAAFRKPLGIVLLAVFMVVGTEALRRQAAREFPDARAADLGRRALAGWKRIRGAVQGRATAATHTRASSGSEEDLKIERLERLAALRKEGLLTQAEFRAEKRKVLAEP